MGRICEENVKMEQKNEKARILLFREEMRLRVQFYSYSFSWKEWKIMQKMSNG